MGVGGAWYKVSWKCSLCYRSFTGSSAERKALIFVDKLLCALKWFSKMSETGKNNDTEQQSYTNDLPETTGSNPVLAHLFKAFGGISLEDYLKHFAVGLVIALLLAGANPITLQFVFLATMNVLLYPYSRVVYSKFLDYFPIQQNFLVTIVSTLVCWGLAILIAPFGLLYLYLKSSND